MHFYDVVPFQVSGLPRRGPGNLASKNRAMCTWVDIGIQIPCKSLCLLCLCLTDESSANFEVVVPSVLNMLATRPKGRRRREHGIKKQKYLLPELWVIWSCEWSELVCKTKPLPSFSSMQNWLSDNEENNSFIGVTIDRIKSDCLF